MRLFSLRWDRTLANASGPRRDPWCVRPEAARNLSRAIRSALSRAPARTPYRCNTHAVSAPQNRDGSGRWPRDVSGNPGGRPKGLAKATREMVGEDGLHLVQLWWDIARDETRRDSDRLRASELLAERGWGKAAVFQPQEGDLLDLAEAEQAAEEFTRSILRLAEKPDQG
jgi:hypothetical protein